MVTDFVKQSSASRSLPASPRYHSHTRSDTSLRGLDGLRSNPIRDSTLGNWRSPQVPHNSPGVVTNHVTVPREPTATNTDLKDFADFIRSTGPAAEQNSTQTPSSAEGKQQGKKITKSNSVDSPGESPVILPQKSEVTPPKRHVSKMQAREATVNRSNTTAELANFLRSDPDGQVDGAGRAMGGLDSATSFDSSLTQGSFAPSKLTQESANSRTALLDTTFGGVEYYEKRRAERIAERIAQAKELARKQGRLTDPNAVESDGGNGGHGAPRPSGPQDESLNDFLRNSTPPPGAATRPGPIGITNAPLHAKQSGLSFRERFSRNVAVIPDNRPVPHKTPRKSSSTNFNPRSDADGNRHIAQRVVSNPSNTFPQSSRPSAHGNHSNSRNNASHLPQPNPHTTIPHLNLQNGTNFGGNPPTHSIPTQHSDRSVRPQARESRGASHPGYIRDLVKFLKETEPEPPLPSEPVKAMNLAKEGSAFGKMFSRKKK